VRILKTTSVHISWQRRYPSLLQSQKPQYSGMIKANKLDTEAEIATQIKLDTVKQKLFQIITIV
jgi:hypothetical protein